MDGFVHARHGFLDLDGSGPDPDEESYVEIDGEGQERGDEPPVSRGGGGERVQDETQRDFVAVLGLCRHTAVVGETVVMILKGSADGKRSSLRCRCAFSRTCSERE